MSDIIRHNFNCVLKNNMDHEEDLLDKDLLIQCTITHVLEIYDRYTIKGEDSEGNPLSYTKWQEFSIKC